MDRDLPINQVVCGDNREIMAQWPDECIDMVITSPPYWGLRNYGPEAIAIYGGDRNCKHEWSTKKHIHNWERKQSPYKGISGERQASATGYHYTDFCIKCNAWRGQLGLEPDFNLYIDHLLEITAELKRILKKTGSFYLNMGDTYWGSGKGKDAKYGKGRDSQPSITKGNGYQNKCLVGIPGRLANAMVDRQGWILRNTIIWNKLNAMPSSVTDRLANTYEFIFRFVKNNKTLFWHNEKMGQITANKPLTPRKGEIDIDWYFYIDDKGNLKRRTYWHGHDCWYDLYAIREAPKWGIVWSRKGASPGTPYDKNNPRKRWGLTKHEIATMRKGSYNDSLHNKPLHPAGKNPGDVMEIQQKLYIVTLADEDREIFKASIPADEVRNCFGHWFGEEEQGNKSDFWIINTQPFPEAHFATFPMKLCEDPIKSSCPLEICKKCGLPRVRVIKINRPPEYNPSCEAEYADQVHSDWHNRPLSKIYNDTLKTTRQTIGWTDCGCNAGWRPGIMLDPFCGSGRALIMAKKLRRDHIGIDIVPEYCEMSKRGLENVKVSISA